MKCQVEFPFPNPTVIELFSLEKIFKITKSSTTKSTRDHGMADLRNTSIGRMKAGTHHRVLLVEEMLDHGSGKGELG